MSFRISSFVVVVVLVSGGWSAPAGAQEESPWQAQVMAHVGHVADAFNGTPEGRGLLPTARAEAEIVVRHAELAARDSTDLEAMQTHAGHVLHAVDPALLEQGPGLGFGLKRAAEAAANHMDFVQEVEDASWAVRTYSGRVEDTAENTAERADQIIEHAQEILQAGSAAQAQPHVRQLQELADVLIMGVDANNDGGVGARPGEGGLEQAEQNLAVLRREVEEVEERGSR